MNHPCDLYNNSSCSSYDAPLHADFDFQVPQQLPAYNQADPCLGYWTEVEVAKLKAAVESVTAQSGSDTPDWIKVASLVPSRSAKQCRQKWLNHLRDGISKDPWSLQEEYVLAVLHSKIGNKWQVLAKYLPRRPENTVKNHWSATTRAKGSARMRTLLWIYADLVVHRNNPHSPEMFERACTSYSQLRGVPPLSAFAVSEDHFLSGPGKGLAGLDSGMAAPMGMAVRMDHRSRNSTHQTAAPKGSASLTSESEEGDDSKVYRCDEGLSVDPSMLNNTYASYIPCPVDQDMSGWPTSTAQLMMLGGDMGGNNTALQYGQAITMMQAGLPNQLIASQFQAINASASGSLPLDHLPQNGVWPWLEVAPLDCSRQVLGGHQLDPATGFLVQGSGDRYMNPMLGDGGVQAQEPRGKRTHMLRHAANMSEHWSEHEVEAGRPLKRHQVQAFGRERRRPQRFRDVGEEDSSPPRDHVTAYRMNRPSRKAAAMAVASEDEDEDDVGMSEGASMLLALADAATLALSEDAEGDSLEPPTKQHGTGIQDDLVKPASPQRPLSPRNHRSSGGGTNSSCLAMSQTAFTSSGGLEHLGTRHTEHPASSSLVHGSFVQPHVSYQNGGRSSEAVSQGPQNPSSSQLSFISRGDVEVIARQAAEVATALTTEKVVVAEDSEEWQQVQRKLSCKAAGCTSHGGLTLSADDSAAAVKSLSQPPPPILDHSPRLTSSSCQGPSAHSMNPSLSGLALSMEHLHHPFPEFSSLPRQPRIEHRMSCSGAVKPEAGASLLAATTSPHCHTQAVEDGKHGSQVQYSSAQKACRSRAVSLPSASVADCVEDSVMETLGKLATDPHLSGAERLRLISSYMEAVQSVVKVSVGV
ncbi:hypothetical protein CEUSTIGMA_g3761.t1 [Chlamydomonas eustigma]|uniref:Uncharacterized protein n=1 Tax=Chlamydomonas eustigma TaxID=1157962 RepID=A0A250WZV2_9CHLO|nr:hypothetical protein CEUSTIGMA_g3761.t1 [Chlamydomonas eustigma]|eukprot:GAX76315.1 hypothetical protein CEUSTIGMA_g3761.t1 [Chlamydomonas eustigma]